MRFIIFSLLLFTSVVFSQDQISIHQQQLEYYNSLNQTTEWYEENVNTENYELSGSRVGCAPDKVVYGWHPYWVGSAYANYDWSLLTHFSFFSY